MANRASRGRRESLRKGSGRCYAPASWQWPMAEVKSCGPPPPSATAAEPQLQIVVSGAPTGATGVNARVGQATAPRVRHDPRRHRDCKRLHRRRWRTPSVNSRPCRDATLLFAMSTPAAAGVNERKDESRAAKNAVGTDAANSIAPGAA